VGTGADDKAMTGPAVIVEEDDVEEEEEEMEEEVVEEVPEPDTNTTTIEAVSTETIIETEEVASGISAGIREALHHHHPVESHITAVTTTETIDVEPSFKVEVEKSIESSGDVKVESTHVKLELPHMSDIPTYSETPEQMIAKAKAMVAEAMMSEEGGDIIVSKKRKVEEITTKITAEDGGEESSGGDPMDEDEDEQRSKKTKLTEMAEEAMRSQKVRTRAMIGLVASLAIGYVEIFFSFLSLPFIRKYTNCISSVAGAVVPYFT